LGNGDSLALDPAWNRRLELRFVSERLTGFRRDPQQEGYTLPNVLFLSKAIANNCTDLKPVFNWLTQKLMILT